jgi:ubiquinone/menaquinone biosynthesis C-methylase UbiE
MMMPVEPDFDHVARVYRWVEYASLGPLLERARNHFLPQLRECRRAMALGDGDGRFLARLMVQNPTLQSVAIDTSAAMLELLRRNCVRTSAGAGNRLTLLHASALDQTPAPETDLIVSHFFMDCLTQAQLNALTQSYARALGPGTWWVISDFALPRSVWLRSFAWIYIRSLYLAFRLLTGLRVTRLPNTQEALEHAGFARMERKDFVGGLVYTEIWRLG